MKEELKESEKEIKSETQLEKEIASFNLQLKECQQDLQKKEKEEQEESLKEQEESFRKQSKKEHEARNNHVVFKGTKDGITFRFQETSTFEEICRSLEAKIKESQKFFNQTKTAVAFQGRTFSAEEEDCLIDIITYNTNIELTFVHTQNEEVETLMEKMNQLIDPTSMTKFHKGALRSGQKIEFDGNVVVFGDVNAGAEIKASGHVIVLGYLRGMAHAGIKGFLEATIYALYLAPIQLRIADLITYFPEEKKQGNKTAEYAFIQDGQVCVMKVIEGIAGGTNLKE